MKWRLQLHDESGFTIQEILVVLVVCSLLVSFGFSLFQFTSKLVSNWGKKHETRSVANGIVQRLALDVQRANAVQEVSDSSLVLSNGIGKQIVFQFTDTSVSRNGVQVGEALRSQLLVKVSPGLPRNASMANMNIAAEARSTVISATAGAIVSVPWSSRQEFTQSLEGAHWNATSNKH